jgi:hypothetical protein
VITPDQKHEISLKLVAAYDRLEKGDLSLGETVRLIDAIEREFPGDNQQKRFYEAASKLAVMVAEEVARDV